MRKIACFLAVAACVSCNYDVADVSGDALGSRDCGQLSVTIDFETTGTKALTDYTQSLAEENSIHKISVLVFDKSTGALNAYKEIESSGDECVLSVTTGEKTVYAVMNGPDLGTVTTIDQFKQVVDDLSTTDIQSDGLVMVGYEDCVVRSRETAEPRITVKRLVARVVLKKITNKVPPQYGAMTIDCVYLGTACTKQTFGGVSSNPVNVGGFADAAKTLPIGKGDVTGSCPAYMYRSVGCSIATGATDSSKQHLYCHPNATGSMTCMYVLVTIMGSQYYYRVPLKDGLEANKTYSVELEIANLGSVLPPDGDFQKGDIMPVINVSGWDAGDSYIVEF